FSSARSLLLWRPHYLRQKKNKSLYEKRTLWSPIGRNKRLRRMPLSKKRISTYRWASSRRRTISRFVKNMKPALWNPWRTWTHYRARRSNAPQAVAQRMQLPSLEVERLGSFLSWPYQKFYLIAFTEIFKIDFWR